VLVDGPNGEIKVAHFGKNDIIGEIAILCDVPRTASVRATTKLIRWRSARTISSRSSSSFRRIAVEIMRELARRLEATTARLRAKGG